MRRRRLVCTALALGTVALGLVVHLARGAPGPMARDVAGDALWATMMYWWIAALRPATSWRRVAAVALLVCFAVEASQAYHAPWIDAARGHLAVRLVLGSDFDARDLVAYVAGVCFGALLDVARSRPVSPR